MTEHILKAHMLNPNDPRYKVNPHEITPGVVYKDDNVTVRAFPVAHGDIEAFGFRFETPDRTIVISGDTTPTQSVIDNCQSCDVLIHEAYSMKTYNAVTAEAQANRKRLHTSTLQLAELAGKAKPGLLILYHRSNLGEWYGSSQIRKRPFWKKSEARTLARSWSATISISTDAAAHSRDGARRAFVAKHERRRSPPQNRRVPGGQ
jgi:ribonuclease BN (tRNA processing enzyme)